jgi:predicted transposase YbfD/YdcC
LPVPDYRRCFADVEDPRVDRTKRHALIDIIMIAVCAYLCGAEGWEDMQAYGIAKEQWLRDVLGLELAQGIPSDDTFRRVFARLDPDQFGASLAQVVRELVGTLAGQVLALDGKTARHSGDKLTGQKAIHVLTAYAAEIGLAVGQVKVDCKSNEITAIPELLKQLDIRGCIVTTDAMGCQRAIAAQITEQGGDYVFGLKGNQSGLHEDVKLRFEDAIANRFYQKDPDRRIAFDFYQTVDKDHGRTERRRYWVMEGAEIAWLSERHNWAGLKSGVAVESKRTIGDKVTVEMRYYISSVTGGAKALARPIRGHWQIENGLHWVLDVSMREDACPIWKDNSPENLATLRRFAIGLLRKEGTSKRGIKGRAKQAAWDDSYLLKVLACATI